MRALWIFVETFRYSYKGPMALAGLLPLLLVLNSWSTLNLSLTAGCITRKCWKLAQWCWNVRRSLPCGALACWHHMAGDACMQGVVEKIPVCLAPGECLSTDKCRFIPPFISVGYLNWRFSCSSLKNTNSVPYLRVIFSFSLRKLPMTFLALD
jgi:hypothetical protein